MGRQLNLLTAAVDSLVGLQLNLIRTQVLLKPTKQRSLVAFQEFVSRLSIYIFYSIEPSRPALAAARTSWSGREEEKVRLD